MLMVEWWRERERVRVDCGGTFMVPLDLEFQEFLVQFLVLHETTSETHAYA